MIRTPSSLFQGTVTKYIFVESYKTTPDDLAARAHEVTQNVMIKDTCFGLQVTGEEGDVERVVDHLRAVDPAHIYVKDRGFPPGDHRRCRANMGGARPGYFGHEYEMSFIRRIAKGIEEVAREEAEGTLLSPPEEQEGSELLDIARLQAIIDEQVV